MPLPVLSSTDSQMDSQASTAPWWGAWSAFLILGCFYLTQSVGIFMVQMVAGLGPGFSQGDAVFSAIDQTWLLPLSLFVATIGGAMVSLRVATSRAKLAQGFCLVVGVH